ncbi:FecR/PupR family sigma factor regulator [Pseudomonas japonica]|uniref:FecR N-terminal domain-containing protein n=1 Tax=Pseudomonas japonica TaxID=256466 RepID=A0A239C2G8_9PSED|nr:DUF4880 domain-containing protein [Pseudomonas japonica]SNS14092.1 protein of unknown function [Pseudomonas japonica]
MKPYFPYPLCDEILTQAAEWCLRLQEGNASVAEREAFAEWVQADPQHAFEYARVLETWELSNALPKAPVSAKPG